jgi:hypothetical protein
MSWSELYDITVDKYPYEFHLHGFSDLQIGSESCSLKVIQQRVEEILDDPVPSGVVILGDIEDEDRPSTRAMRAATFADRFEVISRDAEKHMAWLDRDVIPLLLKLQQTKYGIMGVLAGHHWTQISPVLNSVQYICNNLTAKSKRKVHYLGEMSAFMDLRFSRVSGGMRFRRVVHVQHGEGGGQTKGSSLLKLDRTSQGFIADAYIRAHDCQIVAAKTDQLFPSEAQKGNEPHLLSKTVAFLNLGSATRGYDFNKMRPSYIESKMMRPTTMGWGTLAFNIRKAWKHEDPNQSYKVDMKITI